MVEQLVDHLRSRYADRITRAVEVPAQPARFAAFPQGLDERLARALRSRGIEQLYRHQREAWDAVHAGKDIVVTTPTASGKSLCFHLPVLQRVITQQSRALYLFPTKALSQDQVAELIEIKRAGEFGLRCHTFDGDTPGDARQAVRTKGDIIVTNPDMLHRAVLPHHTKWAQFFENLAFVVVDEAHTYRGVFGAHVANVMRRLHRILAFYRSTPRFIACSATLANGRELSERLLGREMEEISESGAPAGAKHVLLWNPPVVNADLGIRAAAHTQSRLIAEAAVSRGLKSIVFTQTRLMTEVITKYLKDRFDGDPRLPARISGYRGGYLPKERRAAERSLRAGEVDCVVSTSALELGVDIGSLDVCIVNGFPGTVSQTLQRFGRAGRRQRPSLAVLVATSQPLDQFVVRHPEYFLDAGPEAARIDPDQLLVFFEHFRCAAFELPFSSGDQFGPHPVEPFAEHLVSEQVLHGSGQTWHWTAESYPAQAVNLRSVADGNFVVIDTTDGMKKIIAEVDFSSAPLTLYENAIYMVQARPWQVERLDWEGRKAFVRRTRADYYTDAIDFTRLKTLEVFVEQGMGRGRVGHGEVHLVRRVTGFKKIRFYTHENIGYGEIELPDWEMHSTACWFAFGSDLERSFASRAHALDGLLGAAQALHTVALVESLAEKQDISRSVGHHEAAWALGRNGQGEPEALSEAGTPADLEQLAFQPTIFLYDNRPGGIGYSEPLHDIRSKLVTSASSLIEQCACARGCPACVGPILASERQSTKDNALAVLSLLADREQHQAAA